MNEFEIRESEVTLDDDPALADGDGHVVFIGRVCSPWKQRSECPKNLRQARERGCSASVELVAPYRAGLRGLEVGSRIILLSWFDRALRNLIVQKPKHAETPRGVFALRSPVRPNPVGLHVVTITALDRDKGLIGIDAIDLLDGTQVIDIKPYLPTTDSFPAPDLQQV